MTAPGAPAQAAPAPSPAQAQTPAMAESLTPTAGQWWRRRRIWVAIAVGFVVLALVTLLIGGGVRTAGPPLDPQSPAPSGALAINRVLADHGVETHVAASLDEAAELADQRTTVLVHDVAGILDEDGWRRVRALGAERLVILSAGMDVRTVFADVARVEGRTTPDEEDPTLRAGDRCPAGLAERAPTITDLGGIEWRPADDASACWQVRDGYRVVIAERDGTEIVLVGPALPLANEVIADHANAAAAINLLGASERFVWYVPGADDVPGGAGPSFGSYIPQWQLPATLLLITAGLAAIVWRGRRFGPLVTERLPVAVPASETREGRARLYDAGDARLRALDAIRVGTVTRLAGLLGLGRDADLGAIVDAAAAVGAVSRGHSRHVLVDAIPGSDAELVDLANACAEMERRVRAATGRAEPHPTPDEKRKPA